MNRGKSHWLFDIAYSLFSILEGFGQRVDFSSIDGAPLFQSNFSYPLSWANPRVGLHQNPPLFLDWASLFPRGIFQRQFNDPLNQHGEHGFLGTYNTEREPKPFKIVTLAERKIARRQATKELRANSKLRKAKSKHQQSKLPRWKPARGTKGLNIKRGKNY